MDKDGNIDKWCWYDIFWDDKKKKIDHPKRWFQNFYEISDEWDLPWFIMGKVYWLHDYLDWRKIPMGVLDKYAKPYKKKYILKTQYEEEGFDYDGVGDYVYTENNPALPRSCGRSCCGQRWSRHLGSCRSSDDRPSSPAAC